MPNNNPMGLKPGYLNWWQSILLALSCALAGIVAAWAAMNGGISADVDASSWGTDLLKLVPHALMLFGIMADAITYDGVYWTTTLVGLVSIPGHQGLEIASAGLVRIVQGTTAAVRDSTQTAGMRGGAYNGCTLTGGPMDPDHQTTDTLVATASVISYLFFDLWLNRGILNAIGVLMLGLVMMAGQALALSTTCFAPGQPRSITSGVTTAVFFGAIIGGSIYAFFQSQYPMFLPSTVIPIGNTIGMGGSPADSGFVYVPGVGIVSASSPAGMAALANGTAQSADAAPPTGTNGTGNTATASTCS
jgi:hypothetical protein